jgi:hypothetical protein
VVDMRRFSFSIFFAILLLSFLIIFPIACGNNPASPNQRTLPNPEYVPGEVIISFNQGVSDAEIQRIISWYGILEEHHHWSSQLDFYLIKITNGLSVEKVIRRLKEESIVKYAQPNYIYSFGTFE